MSRWPKSNAYFWQTAPFFRLLVPLSAGICLYDGGLWKNVIDVLFLFAATVITLTTLALFRRNILPAFATFLLVTIALLTTGYLVSYTNDDRNNKAWFGRAINTTDSYMVRLTSNPQEKESTWKLPVTVVANGKSLLSGVHGQALIYALKDAKHPDWHRGDTLIVPGKWQNISNAGNPYEFDYARHSRRNNVLHRQFCNKEEIALYHAVNPTQLSVAERAHDWCMQQFEKFVRDKRARGLVQAMLLGNESNLDAEQRQAFTENGIVHIIAISGGNVAIFFTIICYLLWWLRHGKYRALKFGLAVPVVWFYVLMAGAPPSAARAAIMFTIVAVGVLFQRDKNNLNTLFAAMFVLLCLYPMWLFSIGFQLSFTAVLSLILFYDRLYRLLPAEGKIARYLWSIVAGSMAAEVLVAPVVIYYFHLFPLLFLVANVLAVIIMSVVLGLGFGVLLCSFAPAAALLIGNVLSGCVHIFDTSLIWLGQWNPAALQHLFVNSAELAIIYIAIGAIAVTLIHKSRPAVWTSLIAAGLLAALLTHDEYRHLRQAKIIAYNVGKGAHVELVAGKRHIALLTDVRLSNKIAYAANPNHDAFGAWRAGMPLTHSGLLNINGRSVLVADSSSANLRHHVYYLFVRGSANNLAEVKEQFSPQFVVLCGSVSHKRDSALKVIAGSLGMKLHITGQDGAFVVE